ncbi:MAG TPA: hypothetical protein VM490_00530, partial [Armatimonadaceae bacterium]|nr:hypothetical protein [Armatimonadaceae bacterium]
LAGDLEEAEERLSAQLALTRRLKAMGHEADATSMLARLAIRRGDLARAAVLARESLALHRTCGETSSQAHLLLLIAALSLRSGGDAADVRASMNEAVALLRHAGDAHSLTVLLPEAAALLAAEGRPEDAARVLGAHSPYDDPDAPCTIALEAALLAAEGLRPALETTLGPDAFARHFSEGKSLTPAEALASV